MDQCIYETINDNMAHIWLSIFLFIGLLVAFSFAPILYTANNAKKENTIDNYYKPINNGKN